MARLEPGATLPIVRVHGTHADLGRAIGQAQGPFIRRAVASTIEAIREGGVTDSLLREQIQPYIDASERAFPQYLIELREMAAAAEVPFHFLFRLNCYESRPREGVTESGAPVAGTPAGALPVKDPMVQPVTTTVSGEPAAGVPLADGCTSVVSRGAGTVVVGHTEDGSPESVAGIYLLDATVEAPNRERGRFMALNYAFTLPGCAAAINSHGLIVLVDALPNPDRQPGVPREFMCRALLDVPSIGAAIDLLEGTTRGGGANFLLVQGDRYVNVETSAKRVRITESGLSPAFAHSNHYLAGDLAAAAGEPRPNSVARLNRATDLACPGMTLKEMRHLLGDRQGYPDSICRERTIAALVADSRARYIEVCWGEPDTATWTSYTI
jgi:isopenicillin-N N-acyltransferase like protein